MPEIKTESGLIITRVSVLKNDPGYIEKPYLYTVYLDGDLLDNCVTADTVLGEAVCLVNNGMVTLRGIVTINKKKNND